MTSDWHPARITPEYRDHYDPIFRSEEESNERREETEATSDEENSISEEVGGRPSVS